MLSNVEARAPGHGSQEGTVGGVEVGEAVQVTPDCEAEHQELQHLCAVFHGHCMRKPGYLGSVCLSNMDYDYELQLTGFKGGPINTPLP